MARKRTRTPKSGKKAARKTSPEAPAISKAGAQMFARALRHHRRGDLEAAMQDYTRAIRLDPGFADAYGNMGVALRILGRHGAAIACYRRALALGPDNAGVRSNLGNALRDMDRHAEALVAHERAVELDPAAPDVHYNLGLVLRDVGRFEDALAALDAAISLRAGYADYRWDRALTLLQMGDLKRGFSEYEWRWKLKASPPRRFDSPAWDGSDLEGRTILLFQEQGLGDMIQFCRYAALVKDRGGTVILETKPELVRLMSTVAGVDKVVTRDTALPRFDVQAPVLSLPRIFATTLETVPNRVPYLAAPELHNLHLPRARGSNFRVGIVWAGSPTQANDRRRSCPVDQFLALMGLAGVEFFSLQKGEAAKQLQGAASGALVTDLGGRLGDFADTAAVVDQLDLVIAVDTAVVHLAGALGRPVWMLLSYTGDWRLPAGREDSPWYPTMRVFQQERPGDWDGVMNTVLADLEKTVGKKRSGRP